MGFFAWYCISSSLTLTRTITVPIFFDNCPADKRIDAPEVTQISLSGSRSTINASRSLGALHFDSSTFTSGKKLLYPSYKNFLLPSAVKVLNCMPIEVTITSVKQ